MTRKVLLSLAGFVLVAFVAATTPAQQPKAPAFDGQPYYQNMFEIIRDRALSLVDKKTRDQFIKDFEHKHDKDDAFKSKKETMKAIDEMVKAADQRFDHFEEENGTKAFKQMLSASVVGIGVRIERPGLAEAVKKLKKNPTEDEIKEAVKISKDVPLRVKETAKDGPADKAGIKAGDDIVKVDGTSLLGKSGKDATDLITGKEDTDVKITVERKDDKGGVTEQTFTITRKKVIFPVVHSDNRLGKDIGYVKLDDFVSQYTEKEMKAALEDVSANNKALVLDLRGNLGGRLDAALNLAQMLMTKGDVLTITRRHGDALVDTILSIDKNFVNVEIQLNGKYVDSGKDRRAQKAIIPDSMPIVVLIDERSASASEILSGLLQSNKRATIVGKTSLGKGVGQDGLNVKDWMLFVTTFEFKPGGKKMDKVGIIPDVDVARGTTGDAQLDAAKKKAEELLK